MEERGNKRTIDGSSTSTLRKMPNWQMDGGTANFVIRILRLLEIGFLRASAGKQASVQDDNQPWNQFIELLRSKKFNRPDDLSG